MSEAMANVSNRESFRADMCELARRLIPQIDDDSVASGDDDGGMPGMDVTVGCEVTSDDGMSWSYQTGDNSFTGGAYGYAHWGIGYLYRDTTPEDCAAAIIDSLESNDEFSFEVTT